MALNVLLRPVSPTEPRGHYVLEDNSSAVRVIWFQVRRLSGLFDTPRQVLGPESLHRVMVPLLKSPCKSVARPPVLFSTRAFCKGVFKGMPQKARKFQGVSSRNLFEIVNTCSHVIPSRFDRLPLLADSVAPRRPGKVPKALTHEGDGSDRAGDIHPSPATKFQVCLWRRYFRPAKELCKVPTFRCWRGWRFKLMPSCPALSCWWSKAIPILLTSSSTKCSKRKEGYSNSRVAWA